MVPEKFEVNDCTYFLYANDFNIFESLIRDGLINGSVEISNEQLDRICNPVLADKNRNLIYHLVKN